MYLTPTLDVVLPVVWIAMIGGVIGLGRQCRSRARRSEEPTMDELNTIKKRIREDETLREIDRLWQWLFEKRGELERLDIVMDVETLYRDTTRRDKFDSLIASVGNTMKTSADTSKAWDEMKRLNFQLGTILYWFFFPTVCCGGFLLMALAYLSDQGVLTLSVVELQVFVAAMSACAATAFGFLMWTHHMLRKSANVYNGALAKYVTDSGRAIG